MREYGKIANTPTAVKALVAKLARNGHELRFCYEAGPCYGIQRRLTVSEHDCIVVAPSLIPRRPGERIKTDRRDAINFAKLHRAGELTPVWVPDEAHEGSCNPKRKGVSSSMKSLRMAHAECNHNRLTMFPQSFDGSQKMKLKKRNSPISIMNKYNLQLLAEILRCVTAVLSASRPTVSARCR